MFNLFAHEMFHHLWCSSVQGKQPLWWAEPYFPPSGTQTPHAVYVHANHYPQFTFLKIALSKRFGNPLINSESGLTDLWALFSVSTQKHCFGLFKKSGLYRGRPSGRQRPRSYFISGLGLDKSLIYLSSLVRCQLFWPIKNAKNSPRQGSNLLSYSLI